MGYNRYNGIHECGSMSAPVLYTHTRYLCIFPLTPDHDPGIVFLVVLVFSSLATRAEPRRAYSQHVTCHHQVSDPRSQDRRKERERSVFIEVPQIY